MYSAVVMVALPSLVFFQALVLGLFLVLAPVLELVRALVLAPDCVHLHVQASIRHLSPFSTLGSHLGGMKKRPD